MKLSIIIPTLNEAHYLSAALTAVRRNALLAGPHEVIVADCGSVDGTAEVASRLGARVVQEQPPPTSRAAACNRGAAHATGDVFLFLDADTHVPRGYDAAIHKVLRDPGIVGGAFEFSLDGSALGLRLVELINRIRYRLWPRYYGDQGIFVRAAVFHHLRGYPERRLMEASAFSVALGRLGRLALLRPYMKTSARRFLEGGILRVLARDTWIWGLDLLGFDTEHFAHAYQENNHRRGLAARNAPTPTTPFPLFD